MAPRRIVLLLISTALLFGCGSSPEQPSSATVTLDAMSGVPNPTWTLDATQVEELLSRWDGLLPSARVEYPSVLGYRGILVEFDDGSRLSVTSRTAVYKRPGGVEARRDPGRELELWLLDTGSSTVDAPLFKSIRAEIEG